MKLPRSDDSFRGIFQAHKITHCEADSSLKKYKCDIILTFIPSNTKQTYTDEHKHHKNESSKMIVPKRLYCTSGRFYII